MHENDWKRVAGRKGERGVALIIVLGFLGLMLMMAVAFMTQARVERLVSDSSMEAMRVRQIAQTGIAAGIQDYVCAIQGLKSQSEDEHDIFLSGDGESKPYYPPGASKNETYGTTNLWRGKVKDWVWDWHLEGEKDDSVKNMKWIWVVEEPGKMSRILGRYAYACFDMSGAVDANLLGQEFRDDFEDYLPGEKKNTNRVAWCGAWTNRDNVRKMILDGVQALPATDNAERHEKLGLYQWYWQGFDTPLALRKLTDGKVNDGQDGGENRWNGIDVDESSVGTLADIYLSCYSYAATHNSGMKRFTMESVMDRININQYVLATCPELKHSPTELNNTVQNVWMELEDYTSSSDTPPTRTDSYPSVKAAPMFNEIYAKIELLTNPTPNKLKLELEMECWHPFESQENQGNWYWMTAPDVALSGMTPEGDIAIRYRAVLKDGTPVTDTLEGGLKHPDSKYGVAKANWNDGKPMVVRWGSWSDIQDDIARGRWEKTTRSLVYEFDFPKTVATNVDKVMLDDIRISRGSLSESEPFGVLKNTARITGGNLVRGSNVWDVIPSKLKMGWESSRPTLYADTKPGGQTNVMNAYLEVNDPRMNHYDGMWVRATMNSIGKVNAATTNWWEREAPGKLGWKPGRSFYCRNGDMQTPAELGYIPVWSEAKKTPWMTVNIFDDNVIDIMNKWVTTDNIWNLLSTNHVFYTNGTINPYTKEQAVLNGAFYALDLRVPGCTMPPKRGNLLSQPRTTALTDELIKPETPEGNPFRKDGPAGWARVLRYKNLGLEEEDDDDGLHSTKKYPLDKVQRVALLRNTWGLFNESDKLFVIVVVAQSVSEAPDNVDRVGHWNEDDDEITGERWAVALCWTDASESRDPDDPPETDIIMFQYLNE